MALFKSVVAIGASAGGIESLREVIGGLPKDFPSPVFVVLHIPPYRESSLPSILTRAGAIPAHHPSDGDRVKAGRIYTAPPDHHMLVEDGSILVKRGPKENRFRPSIDALFRSAAYSYGANVVGVVLSGALDDGTSGLWTIKRLGGITVVQRPNEARFESMPLSAIREVSIDHTVSAREIGPLLQKLVAELDSKKSPAPDEGLRSRVKTELKIAAEGGAFQKGIMELGELTPFTCPECHGVLVKLKEDKLTRYRCHTGHGYSDSALLEGVMKSSGEQLWQVMRSLEEAVMVVEHMGKDLEEAGDKDKAKVFFAKAKDLESRSKEFHKAVLDHESLSGDNLAAT
jgi:two-component system, chemotaxis family, protein-glutamate methylesterase/glutaminase